MFRLPRRSRERDFLVPHRARVPRGFGQHAVWNLSLRLALPCDYPYMLYSPLNFNKNNIVNILLGFI